MTRDLRTLSRMLSRGEPPETLEDMWMIVKNLSAHLAALEGQVAMLRNAFVAQQRECPE